MSWFTPANGKKNSNASFENYIFTLQLQIKAHTDTDYTGISAIRH